MLRILYVRLFHKLTCDASTLVTVATLSYLFMSVDPLLGMLKCCLSCCTADIRRAEVMQDVTARLSKGNYAQAVATTRAAR